MANSSGTGPPEDLDRLRSRIHDLEHEREHLLAVIGILEDISGTLHFVDILQSITRKLGELYGLDRCSIFLAERRGTTARLVAFYEDPAIRNYVVDLDRYPELKRAPKSGESGYLPDAPSDPNLKRIHAALTERGAKPITVIPVSVARSRDRGNLPANVPRRSRLLRIRSSVLRSRG